MNLIATNSPDKLSLHVIVERVESGHFKASVPELIDCVISAETREAAIAAIQEKVTDRLKNIEILKLEVPKNPWLDFIGIFEGDKDFEEISAQLLAERELDFDTDGAA